jgi:hypothetical protein
MKLYLTFSQIPELQKLPKEERKLVYAECIFPILRRWPTILIRYLFTFAVFYGAFRLELLDSISRFICFMIGYMLADHLLDVAIISCLRSRLRKEMLERNFTLQNQGEQAGSSNGG